MLQTPHLTFFFELCKLNLLQALATLKNHVKSPDSPHDQTSILNIVRLLTKALPVCFVKCEDGTMDPFLFMNKITDDPDLSQVKDTKEGLY